MQVGTRSAIGGRTSPTLLLCAVLGLLVGLVVVAPTGAEAQDGDEGRDGLPSTALRELVEGARSGGGPSTGEPGSADRVTVEVLHDLPTAEAEAAVAAVGGTVTGSVPGELVQADVPIAGLESLQATEGIRFIRPPLRLGEPVGDPGPLTAGPLTAGPVTGPATTGPAPTTVGAQVAKTNVDDWHVEGHTGQNVRVGIIDSFDRPAWEAAVAAGELPQPRGTFCLTLGIPCDIWDIGIFNDTHGVGVAEIIHDQAPSAELFLAVVYTPADLQAAVDWFIANGVTVVNRSQTAEYDGPGDGTGPTAAIIDHAVDNGILWANSAGNASGTTGSTGEYYRGTWSDPDDNGWHNFSGSDEHMRVLCNFTNGVRWSDWGSADPTDYDVYVWRELSPGVPDLSAPLGVSSDDQGAGAPPLELLNFKLIGRCTMASEYVYVSLKKVDEGDGSSDDVIEAMANQSRFEYWQNPYAASGPIVDSANPGALAVGAIDPAAGTTIASYSSWGPTNDERLKPDVSAASCVWTTVSSCFNGTSAASPTTAGVAAVVKSSGLHTTPVAIGTYLRSIATDRGEVGPDLKYGAGEVILPAPPPAPLADALVHPLSPARVLDTRSGLGAPVGRLGPKASLDLDVTGPGGVPDDGVAAVVLNLTAVQPNSPTHLTVHPADTPRPNASSLNADAFETAANLVVARVGSAGTVRVFNNAGSTHVVADVVGWIDDGTVVGGQHIEPLPPARLLDTRKGTGAPVGSIGPKETLDLVVAGNGGVPPTGAAAVLLNLTAVAPSADTHVTAFPFGSPRPATSNLNPLAGQTRPNAVLVPLGPGGRITLFNNAGEVHLVADVIGFTGTAATDGVVTQGPARAVDSRFALGQVTALGGVVPSGSFTTYDLTPGAGLPAAGVGAALVNVTVTDVTEETHVSVIPGIGVPVGGAPTSSLNLSPGQTRANLVYVPVDADGNVTVYNRAGEVGVIIDVVGWTA